MKTNQLIRSFLCGLSVVHFGGTAVAAPFVPVTYQGRLEDQGQPASGTYELRVGLFSVASGNVALQQVTNIVTTSNGLFTTVLSLDAALLPALSQRWLELGVRTNGSGAAFAVLTPRQELTYSPHAVRAITATLASDLANDVVKAQHIVDGAITAAKIDTGQVVKSLNGLRDNVTLAAGSGIAIAPVGNTLTIAGVANDWRLLGNAGTTAGVNFLGTTDDEPLEIKVNNIRAVRIVDNGDSIDDGVVSDQAPSIVIGASNNLIGANTVGATISGGGANNWEGLTRTHWVYSDYGTVAGGLRNRISSNSLCGTISGGYFNNIETNSPFATVNGGNFNDIFSGAWYGTIGGGQQNQIRPNAQYGTVPGGHLNSATNYAFAAGRRAKANHTGAFVWADSLNSDFASAEPNQFLIRAGGGVGIARTNHGFEFAANLLNLAVGANTNGRLNGISFREFDDSTLGMSLGYDGSLDGSNNRLVMYDISATPRFIFESGGNLGLNVLNPGSPIEHSSGAVLTAGGVWQNASDVHRKTDFETVDPQNVLDKLLALPIQSWRYTNELAQVRHLGPTAQDFQARFGLGTEATSIGTVDADGVALAAIQGLNQKFEAEAAQKDREIAALKRELANLKQLVEKLSRAGD